MVKNTGGGGNAKRQARKFQGKNKSEELRKSENPSEVYAIVDLIYGNGLNIYTNTGQEIWCRVPGKFKGRNKRNNFIEKGAWVLVGIYEWENNKAPKSCELLYIYDRNEIEQLQSLPDTKVNLLIKKTNGTNNNNSSSEPIDDDDDEFDGFKFTEDVVDKKTMFADETNVAVVTFANDTQINIDDL